MYTNLAKNPAFPFAMRVSSHPASCFKLFHTPNSGNPLFGSAKATGRSSYSHCRDSPKGVASTEFWRTRNAVLVKGRSFSYSSAQKVNGRILPWLTSKEGNENLAVRAKARSSWEESAEKLDRVGVKSSWEESAKKLDTQTTTKPSRDVFTKRSTGPVVRRREMVEPRQRDIYVPAEKRSDTDTKTTSKPFRDILAKRRDDLIARNRVADVVEDRRRDYTYDDETVEGNAEEEEEEEEAEIADDPRWDKIKSRFRGVLDVRDRYEKPEFRRWNKEENRGRQMWKEATESSLPKMVGEAVYGVGPVLAALCAGRREFYSLHVQEGMDLSKNNRKKKDKKGYEKILKTAENLGIRVNQTSKHDLNMMVENRPHQGVLLDASPLEMVKIKELDPVCAEEDNNALWVALDEVTDPQNLGAIIRSSYFFGASGVVLCAKNSAPLSGVVSKASAGSLEFMELRFCKNMMQFLESSAENGWRVIGGSVSSRAVSVNEVAVGAPTVLVLGSEGTGLRPLVERSCSQLVRIDSNIAVDSVANAEEETADFRSFMAVESLNVSVAAGVLLHHFIGNKTDSPTTQ